jgi:AraC-like DNA-binding protein
MRPTDPARYRDSDAALPLARYRLVETGDAKVAHAEAVKLFAPHRLETPAKAPFQALLHHLRLGSLAFYFIRYKPGAVIASGPMKRYYLCLVPVAGVCEVTQALTAMRLVPGTLGVVNASQPISLRWRNDCAQLVVKIDRKALDEVASGALALPVKRPIEFEPEPVRLDAAAPLVALIDFLYADLDASRSAASSRAGEAAAANLFLNTLLRQVPNSLSQSLDRPASRAAPYYVRRAEEFLQMHAAAEVSLDEVVAVAGVSARTLFKGFSDFRGIGPMAFLKGVRLDMARQDLAAGAPRRGVTEVAQAWQFQHLGHFARDYKARFGELPSDTRRRAGR